MNRLTITLPDDLYAMARAHAVANRKSISKAIGDLLRQGRSTAAPHPNRHTETAFQIDPVTKLPVVRGSAERITMEDVRRAEEDDDIRHLETMGLRPEEIQRSLAR